MIKPWLLALVVLLAPAEALAVHIRGPGVDINSERVVHLRGEIVPAMADAFEMAMLVTSNQPGDRVVVIHSQGGRVDEGERIWKMLEADRREGHRIVCVVDRRAASMAFNILTRCDVRLAMKKAMLLFHRVARDTPCGDERCTGVVLERVAQELMKVDEPYRQANAAALGMPLPEYDLHADNDTFWRAETLVERKYLAAIVYIAP